MSLDILLIGVVFVLLAFIGLLKKRGKPVGFSHLCSFIGLCGLLITVCGVLD